MSKKYFDSVCTKIDANKSYFASIGNLIWSNPELGYEERKAHDLLTNALAEGGFQVERSYVVPTAFKAEFSTSDSGPVLAILLEYDALPGLGHACGHNLIAEAGLAASFAIKAEMEADPTLEGKLLVLGTPAEEGGGGKIKMLRARAFEGVSAALMMHPANFTCFFPPILSRVTLTADFQGKEAHAAVFPWEGHNALDAAVAAYQNLALLRQQIKPTERIHVIISKGGTVTNIIPAESRLLLSVRSATQAELEGLVSRVRECITSGATATGCTVEIRLENLMGYENLITNRVVGTLFQNYAEELGIENTDFSRSSVPAGSTDMGNVSRVLPAIHPFIKVNTDAGLHSKEFAQAAGSLKAQVPALLAAKAMALTVLELMRCPEKLDEARLQFKMDIAQGL